MTHREFRLADEHHFDRRGPARWILSQLAQYPWLPAAAVLAALVNNFAASYIQVLIGRGFDLLNTPDWTTRSLFLLALAVFASAADAVSTTRTARAATARWITVDLLARGDGVN